MQINLLAAHDELVRRRPIGVERRSPRRMRQIRQKHHMQSSSSGAGNGLFEITSRSCSAVRNITGTRSPKRSWIARRNDASKIFRNARIRRKNDVPALDERPHVFTSGLDEQGAEIAHRKLVLTPDIDSPEQCKLKYHFYCENIPFYSRAGSVAAGPHSRRGCAGALGSDLGRISASAARRARPRQSTGPRLQ